MSIDRSLIAEIVRRVLEVLQPDKIIIFGSAATDTMTLDSDIDLLILEKSPDLKRDSVLVDDKLRGLPFPFDVIVMATQRYEETKDLIGGLAYPAAIHGKVIYESA
jgi:predicted nucleotidyltransferase